MDFFPQFLYWIFQFTDFSQDYSWIVPLLKKVFHHIFISVNNRSRAQSKYVNKLAIGVFIFLYHKLNNMDGVKQQDSTPQNDSTLGFKWIKKIPQYIV